ncbi:peptide ABC transporter substrate-binding protein [Streptococcus cuniculi]|uniref:Peptide ABC transporter substrate-binding protein n=1 Tax=Streptococcus cuniculi TaxID=1432788 RepID=A0A4Y9JA02_9STRE|nr:peptide ABC transporter substrate-binding protein [Streptococcus cuniculi]MBF0779051.1 peptide ABC transporter substrate-binding protein [Streptococcus cuniculi]TFU97018.1 peptide ABC transporter substrate-binding protein [Streptococcus cuniculi]
MNKKRLLMLAGVSLLSVGVLAGCSGGSSSSAGNESVYGYVYSADPESLDYLTTSKASTLDIVTNGVDGLLENDQYGNLVPSLAEDWKVSKDGLTYTYTLRKGVKWYTSDGEEYAEVKAQDFVAGLKHAADKKSESLYLIQDSIKGLDAYVKGESTDFASVGIKAVDDYTVQYTLNSPEPYWNSKTTNGILFPVNEEFLTSKGDKFAQPTDPSSILYNGPFLLKSLVSKSSVEFAKNENYWDKDNVHLDSVKLSYYDGQDVDSLARNFTEGAYSVARLFPSSPNYAKVAEDFKDNIFVTQPGVGSGAIGVNIDRQTYEHTSKKTDEEKNSTKKALLNKDFRQAVNFAFDRKAYSSQVNGEDGAEYAVRNLFVPSDFVSVGEKTFGDVVEEKIISYGDEWKDVKLADSVNGIYNPEKAKAEFEKAKKALEAEGVTFPIHLDTPVVETSKNYVSRMQSFKQSVESVLGSENVVIDLQMMSEDDAYNITYYAANAKAEDWDISGLVGWNPDYSDPSTYLDILESTNPDQTKTYFGFEGADNANAKAVGFDTYNKLTGDANKEVSDIAARYEKYAEAQAWMADSSLLMPTMASSGAAPFLSRVEPFSGASATSGNKSSSSYYKYLKVGKDVVTKKQYEEARKKWLEEKAESNAKAQKDLESHVE